MCAQFDDCVAAKAGRSFAIPLGSPFTCPDCGHGLQPPVQVTPPPLASGLPPGLPLALLGLGVLVLGGAVFLGVELGGRRAGPPPAMVSPVVHVQKPPLPARVAGEPAAPAVVQPLIPGPQAAAAPPPAVQAVPAPTPSAGAPPVTVPPVAVASVPKAMAPLRMATAPDPIGAMPATLPPQQAVVAPKAGPLTADRPAPSTPVLPNPGPQAEPRPAPSVLHAGNAAAPSAPTSSAPLSSAPSPAPALPPLAAPEHLPPLAAPEHLPPLAAPEHHAPVAVAALPTPRTVPDQPFSPVPLSGGSPAYPASLAADGRPGRVSITCRILQDGVPAGCHVTTIWGGPAFAATTLAWLARGHVRYRPVVLDGIGQAVVRSWAINIEEPPAVAATARRERDEAVPETLPSQSLALPPPAPKDAVATPATATPAPPAPKVAVAAPPAPPPPRPKGITRGFVTRVVSGGSPVFPKAYDDGRSGAVTVDCLIGTEGTPSDCNVVKDTGGPAFARAVRTWLDSGRVRFQSILKDGEPVSQHETWTVVFSETPPP